MLIQTGVIVGGTLFVAAMLKAHGYKGGTVPDSFFKSAALFVRNSGFMFLLLPVAWAASAIFAARKSQHSWCPLAILLLGIATVLFGICNYIMLGFSPCIL